MKDYRFEFEMDEKKYHLVFNLNVMQVIQEEYGSIQKWGDLTDKKNKEINVKALIFGLTEMMNEAIDMENETAEIKKSFFTKKQVGRIITAFGIEKTAEKLNQAVIESTKTEAKN